MKGGMESTIDDPDLRRRAASCSIPHSGLARQNGDRRQLLAYIGRAPRRLHSVKALIAYASLAPLVRQSGTSLDKRCGTHPMGHQALGALALPGHGWRCGPLIVPFWRTSSRAQQGANRARSSSWPACTSSWPSAYGVLRPVRSTRAPKPQAQDSQNGVFTSRMRLPVIPQQAPAGSSQRQKQPRWGQRQCSAGRWLSSRPRRDLAVQARLVGERIREVREKRAIRWRGRGHERMRSPTSLSRTQTLRSQWPQGSKAPPAVVSIPRLGDPYGLRALDHATSPRETTRTDMMDRLQLDVVVASSTGRR